MENETPLRIGDPVRFIEGTFENFRGTISEIDEASGRATVAIDIFGRSTPVDVEPWHIERITG